MRASGGSGDRRTGPTLYPHDVDLSSLTATSYPLSRLYEALRALQARETIAVLDTCFSGTGGRSIGRAGEGGVAPRAEEPRTGGTMAVVTANTGRQSCMSDPEQGHGILTYFFLKGLQGDGDLDHDGIVDIDELSTYTRPRVAENARDVYGGEQVPHLSRQASGDEQPPVLRQLRAHYAAERAQ